MVEYRQEDTELLRDLLTVGQFPCHDDTLFHGISEKVYDDEHPTMANKLRDVPIIIQNGVDVTTVTKDSGEYNDALDVLIRIIEYTNILTCRQHFGNNNNNNNE